MAMAPGTNAGAVRRAGRWTFCSRVRGLDTRRLTHLFVGARPDLHGQLPWNFQSHTSDETRSVQVIVRQVCDVEVDLPDGAAAAVMPDGLTHATDAGRVARSGPGSALRRASRYA